MTTTMSDTDLLTLLQHDPAQADAVIAVTSTNDLSRVATVRHAVQVWEAWCRTRAIPDSVRTAHEARLYAYYAEFSGFDLEPEQVAYRCLSRLDTFYMSLHDKDGVGLGERDIAPVVALHWVHTFGYPSFRTLDNGADRLTAWHPLTDRAWALAAAGLTPTEYVAAALDGTAPTHDDAKVLAALRGYHFLPEPQDP